MTLLSDVLRVVFDGGETLATLGPSVAVVLTRRDATLARGSRTSASWRPTAWPSTRT